MHDEPVFRGILGIDIERYSRAEWTDPIRARLRERLYALVTDALTSAQIPPSSSTRTDTGDGLWLLVHPEISTVRLLRAATALAAGLSDDNQHAPGSQRLRVRVVVHAGALLADAHGHAGASLNHAARLLDAEATRAVLAHSPAADVVVAVSDEVYQGVVAHAYPGIDPAGWQPIQVHVKETRTRAWVHLPGLATQPGLPAVLTAPRVGPASLPTPRELPPPPGDFTGRTGELAMLRTLLDVDALDAGGSPTQECGPRPVVISAIDGMGGIGKSALAIQAAHQLADAFPDGQLYVNLHGATPGLAPLDPLAALGHLLSALGLDPAAIPTEVEEAAARWRSLAAQRRLLVVLDNARDAEQVRSLLPGSPSCAVLITSRQVLATLEGAHRLHLDILAPDQAVELLGRIAGPHRIAVEPQAAAEVVGWCGRLPLAIRIAGARLAARPAWTVAMLAERLADATGRLEELQAGELAVRASFEVSLATLRNSSDPTDRAAAAAFGLLSLPDGPDLGVPAAARLLDRPEPATERLLERLVDAQLLESPRPHRYQFHDLLRLYARQHAAGQAPEAERLAALTRLVGFYTATAWHTCELLHPGARFGAFADPQWTDGGLRFANAQAALVWLETERANLLAAITQIAATAPALPARLAGQLSSAMWAFFAIRSHWQDAVHANRTALGLAERTGDRITQAWAHNDLGVWYRRLGRYAEAVTCHQRSLAIFHERNDRYGRAYNLLNLGLVHHWLEQIPEAVACHQESLAIARELDNRNLLSLSLSCLGVVYERLGQYPEAIAYQRQSLAVARELGARHYQGNGLMFLGLAYGRVGQCPEAIACLQESLAIAEELGDRFVQAHSLTFLGLAYERLERHAEAIACQQDSLIIKQQLGDRRGEAEGLRDLGDALHGLGRHDDARAAWQQALVLYEQLQIPEAAEIHARLTALPSQAARLAAG